MTVAAALLPVTEPMIRALVDDARRAPYRHGVIAVRAQPSSTAPGDFEHDGMLVRVRVATSTLGVRDAMLDRDVGEWLVVVTDRDDADLGPGILAHVAWHRVRRPDPWEAVRNAFQAKGIDPALTGRPDGRELAAGLLAAKPADGWPPAPAGSLTQAHALSAVAAQHVGYYGDAGDALGVLGWCLRPGATTDLAALRSAYGDPLADATVRWIAANAGAAAPAVGAHLRGGRLGEIVPFALAVALLTDAATRGGETGRGAELALATLKGRWGSSWPGADAVAAVGAAGTTLVADLAVADPDSPVVDRVCQAAETMLAEIDAEAIGASSPLLAGGHRLRVQRLARALRLGLDDLGSSDDAAATLADAEQAWHLLVQHRLARRAPSEHAAALAGVRLLRWLAVDPDDASVGTADAGGAARVAGAAGVAGARAGGAAGRRLTDTANHYVTRAAWADAAINDAAVGVSDPMLADALEQLVGRARARRDSQERAFAVLLRRDGVERTRSLRAGERGLYAIEDVLPQLVLPMAARTPVLLIVADGMSVTAATEIVADAVGRLRWTEATVAARGVKGRVAALSALPSVTEFSRASLLAGRLLAGQQDAERAAYGQVCEQVGKVTATLFHKRGVETTRPGWILADGLAADIDDADGLPLVTVVLNTIDDALDRSDPSGTTWTADAVKHLEPLLARARGAGRTVVLTSDHGHVVERRQGQQRHAPDATSGRSRAADPPAGTDEVLVAGERVLTPVGSAVLAVDEGLRYGPLKAGYHGGGTAAETVVPVVVLLPHPDLNPLGLTLLGPQAPQWWTEPVGSAAVSAAPPPGGRTPVLKNLGPTLFPDELVLDTAPPAGPTLGTQVTRSAAYRAQVTRAPRRVVDDARIGGLVDALAAASAQRLGETAVATLLALPEHAVRGAIAQVMQILNVEGYAVIRHDVPGRAVLLDLALLREQFGVS